MSGEGSVTGYPLDSYDYQGGRSCAKVQRAFGKKFGLGRKFKALMLFCHDIFICRIYAKNDAFVAKIANTRLTEIFVHFCPRWKAAIFFQPEATTRAPVVLKIRRSGAVSILMPPTFHRGNPKVVLVWAVWPPKVRRCPFLAAQKGRF